MQRPSSKDYESMKTWLQNEKPLVKNEMAYIRHKEDIVTTRKGRESAAFDCFVERVLSRLDKFLVARCHWHLIKVVINEGSPKRED